MSFFFFFLLCCSTNLMFLYRRKSRSVSPRHRRSRSPSRRHKSRSPSPRHYKRQRSKSSSLSPIRKSPSSSLGSIDRKNASEKLRIEEEEKKRYIKSSITSNKLSGLIFFFLSSSPPPPLFCWEGTWGLYGNILISSVIVLSPIFCLFYWTGEHKNSQGKLWCFLRVLWSLVPHRSEMITFNFVVP